MKMTSTAAWAALACAAAMSTSGVQAQESQGVSKTEITLGSIQDLSGPLAGFGKQLRNGMMLRVRCTSLSTSSSTLLLPPTMTR